MDFFLKSLTSRWANSHGTLLPLVPSFFCWLKSHNCAVLTWKSVLFSANYYSTQLPWLPWILLIDWSVGPILTAPCCRECRGFFADLSLITVSYCCENSFFSQLIFTAPSCLECCGFFVYNYWLVDWANSHGTLLPWVPSFFYCLLKSYNSAVMSWKSIIFWLKLLTRQIGQLSRHLAAVSAMFFFVAVWSLITVPYCREKTYFSQIVFISRHTAVMSAVDFLLSLLTSQLGQFLRHLDAVSALVFLFCFAD